MFIKIFLTLVFTFLGVCFAYAEPVLNSVSGTFSHGAPISITGSNFGTKNPAAPLVWDAGNHNDPLSARYIEAWPDQCSDPYYNIAYRTAPFRGISAPHSHATKIIAGAHYLGSGTSTRGGNNVNLTVSNWRGSKKHFMMYYYRLDPNFPKQNPSLTPSNTGPNYKTWASQSTNSIYGNGTGTWSYIASGGIWGPAEKYPDDVCLGLGSSSHNPSCWNTCSGVNGSTYPNPMGGWQHYEWAVLFPTTGGDDGFVNFYADGIKAISCPNGNVEGNEYLVPASASIGGFTRVPVFNPENAWRYFTDVYMDNTFSRVILANNQNYDSATIKEPQIPSSWSNASITVTVNLGKLQSGTAYLFVFDADNNHNALGYPVIGAVNVPAPPVLQP